MGPDLMPVMLTRPVVRFALTGLLVTGLHALVAVAFMSFIAGSPPLANGTAFLMATVVSYLVNTRWSFSKPLHGRNMLRFCLVSLVGLSLSVAVASAGQHYGLHYWYGILAVVCVVPPVTFLLHSCWTYR